MASFIEEVAMDTGIIRRRAYASIHDAEFSAQRDGPEQGLRQRSSGSEISCFPSSNLRIGFKSSWRTRGIQGRTSADVRLSFE